VINLGDGKLSEKVKKNLLDINYSKYLQYFNTTIIISFTYIIGVSIAFITKQVNYRDPKQLFLVALISIGFLGIMVILLLKFKEHIDNIPKQIKKLNL
tara:strand:+ start:2336 stop:2629 length:294 start_codon:yes stop_codon:yes gene_type:complete